MTFVSKQQPWLTAIIAVR